MAFSSVIKIIGIILLCNFSSLLNLGLRSTYKSNSTGSMPKKKKSVMISVEIGLGSLG